MNVPTTHWTEVYASSEPDSDSGMKALNSLVSRYQNALILHLNQKFGFDRATAQDFLQGFVEEKILRKSILAAADKKKGRFRSFLLSALDRYCLNEFRRAKAKRRAPSGGFHGDGNSRIVDSTDESCHHPIRSFELAWAVEVMNQARRRMKEECECSGRLDVWEVFQGRILRPILQGGEPIRYGEIVERHNLRNPEQASNLLITAKRMFLRNLKSAVSEYERSEGDVDSELEEIKIILSRPDAWNSF